MDKIKTDSKNSDSGIYTLMKKMFPYGVVLLVLCWCFTLIWGFDLSTLTGFVVGFVYACISCAYLGYCCENSVKLDVKKAKRKMLGCYFTRFSVLFLLCAFAMLTKKINVVGVLVPQFYPKIVLQIMQWSEKSGRKEKI